MWLPESGSAIRTKYFIPNRGSAKGRSPIIMVRSPTGQEKKCFYQRHAGSGVPEQVKTIRVPGFDDPYLYIEDVGGLVAMVQMGVLEIHPWGVTTAILDKPDRLIFDLDPDEE